MGCGSRGDGGEPSRRPPRRRGSHRDFGPLAPYLGFMRRDAQSPNEVPTQDNPQQTSPGAHASMSQHRPDRAFDMPADDRVLTDGDVKAIAEATATRHAEIVSAAPGTFALVDARQLARDLGVSLDYVYAH